MAYGSVSEVSTISQICLRAKGSTVPGAEDRQGRISGFDQQALSSAHVLCIGAGGLISHIAPTLARKGIGRLTILDHDEVEASNLNRQRFYPKDIGKNKAFALVENLVAECIYPTDLRGYGTGLEAALGRGMDLSCDLAICGVDNNPARVVASRHFQELGIPVIFAAVSADADHGYVFVQEPTGSCLGCLFPDLADSRTYPCPGTPAVADILQVVGAMAVYTVDTCLMARTRTWNYRRVCLGDGSFDSVQRIPPRENCALCGA
jgi:molybdopterin/thiamine biosynthesis adenylyltransferase